MFTDEDRKRALEALAANGGRVTKTLRELGLPLDRFGHESFIPTAQLVGNEVEYMLDDQRAAPGVLDNILAAPFHDLLLPRMDGPLSVSYTHLSKWSPSPSTATSSARRGNPPRP